MHPPTAMRGLVALLLVAGTSACTPGGDDATPDPSESPSASVPASPSLPSVVPSPTVAFDEDALLGEGTLAVDGQEVAVTGDCDISREFGQAPVTDVGDPDVDILLAVGNLGRPPDPDRPALRVSMEMLGVDAAGDRTVVVSHVDEIETTRLRGTVETLALVDRTELEFVDVATLHVEAEVGADDGTPLDVVADVTCVISRPG